MKPIRTPDEFSSVVKIGATPETLFLEFKEKADGFSTRTPAKEKRKGQIELVADIAQFANSEGGCILYGVSEVRCPLFFAFQRAALMPPGFVGDAC
ncbi:MAG: hypothetical protein ISP90_08535 [Nevskia sp.]|nr:hypothetical protein [Nevskia sp.]